MVTRPGCCRTTGRCSLASHAAAAESPPAHITHRPAARLSGFIALPGSGEDHLPRPSPVPGPAGQHLGVLRLDRSRPAHDLRDDLDDAYAANQLHDAWVEHRRTYGARRLTAEIGDRDQQGQAWNRKKVARLMTVAGIEGIHRRRHGKKRSRISTGSVAPDTPCGVTPDWATSAPPPTNSSS